MKRWLGAHLSLPMTRHYPGHHATAISSIYRDLKTAAASRTTQAITTTTGMYAFLGLRQF
jgi:hypothetical protein